MSIALTFIATDDYIAYVPGLIDSARRHLLWGHEMTYWCFSDQEPPRAPDVRWRYVEHEPWPGPTLHRYRHLETAADSLACYDYVFHCDADARFVGNVYTNALGSLVATLHAGFASRPVDEAPYESNRLSAAYIPEHNRKFYYCGGFQGGTSQEYLDAVRSAKSMIDEDATEGIVACWHDESYWNAYLVDFPPEVTLPATFLCCETKQLPKTKLLSLMKPDLIIYGQNSRTR